MSKHAQGKWFINLENGFVRIRTDDKGYVHTIAEVSGRSLAELCANAHILVAAPEMYELLRQLALTTKDDPEHDKLLGDAMKLLASIDEGRRDE